MVLEKKPERLFPGNVAIELGDSPQTLEQVNFHAHVRRALIDDACAHFCSPSDRLTGDRSWPDFAVWMA